MKLIHLYENVHNRLEGAGETFIKHIDDARYGERIRWATKTLSDALVTKHIWNVDYIDAKERLSRAWETALQRLFHNGEQEIEGKRVFNVLYDAGFSSYMTSNEVPKANREMKEHLKTMEAGPLKDHFQKIYDVFEAALVVVQAVKDLKGFVEKGRKPNPDSKAALKRAEEVKRMGSAEARRIVEKHLKEGIKKPLDQFEVEEAAYINQTIQQLAKHKTMELDVLEDGNPMDAHIFRDCFDYEMNTSRGYKHRFYDNIKLKATAKGYAKRKASEMRKEIEDHFISKNNKKLSYIIDKKENLERVDQLPYRAPHLSRGLGTIEAGFHFRFHDGSEFQVVNKVIINRSSHGTMFYQYPLTFHNVQLPGNKPMKSPSETKMNTIFIGEGGNAAE